MIYQIEQIIEKIRPMLAQHKGNVELIDVDNNKVFIVFKGGCQGCVLSSLTVKDLIGKEIKQKFPELEIVDLTNHSLGKTPYKTK